MGEWKKKEEVGDAFNNRVYSELVTIITYTRNGVRIYHGCRLEERSSEFNAWYTAYYQENSVERGKRFYNLPDEPLKVGNHSMWCHENEQSRSIEVLREYFENKMAENKRAYEIKQKNLKGFLDELERGIENERTQ